MLHHVVQKNRRRLTITQITKKLNLSFVKKEKGHTVHHNLVPTELLSNRCWPFDHEAIKGRRWPYLKQGVSFISVGCQVHIDILPWERNGRRICQKMYCNVSASALLGNLGCLHLFGHVPLIHISEERAREAACYTKNIEFNSTEPWFVHI